MYNEAMLAGIIISMLYTELTGLSAGLIVPGYLALNLHSPGRLVFTLAVAAGSVGICRVLSSFVILYGRRRFAMLILLSFLLSEGLRMANLLPSGVTVIGILIPGIIAREVDRQGFVDSLLSLCITTGILALFFMLLGYPVWRL